MQISEISSRLRKLGQQQATSGVTYGLLVGLLAIGVISGITTLGERTGDVFNIAKNEMTSASSSGGQGANTVPTISDIADDTIGLDETYGPVGFTVSDSETAPASLSVTATSSNIALVQNANITIGGSGENRTITATTESGQSGTTTITVTVDDGTDTSSDSFVLTVLSSPSCSGGVSSGSACIIDGEEVVYVANYDPGDGGGSRAFYVQHCDQSMTWAGSYCDNVRTGDSWNNGGTNYTDTSMSSSAYQDGAANTDILVAEDSATGGGVDPHNAAQSCRDIGPNWFLPARDEMDLLYTNRNTGVLVGTFLTSAFGNYWSSTEGNLNAARSVLFSDGSHGVTNKEQSLYVRCARRP